MRTIEGRVRPFGQGTNPSFVRLQFPETLDEVEEVLSELYAGDPIEGLLKDASRKALIRVQDEVRGAERWEGREAPDAEDATAWAEIQDEITGMVSDVILDLGTWPGERKSSQPDALDEARKDPQKAEELIEQLRAQHGL